MAKQLVMNKTIWMYWHQGFDAAPALVQHCVNSWKKHHQGWDIKLLDSESIKEYNLDIPLSEKKLEQLGLAHRSDLIRTKLLIEFGGVWIDPTCFAVECLDNWLLDHMKVGLFMFVKPGRDRIISNWFIAAEKNNVLLEKLLSELCSYWENNTFKNNLNKSNWLESQVKRVYSRSFRLTKLWFTTFTKKILKIYPYMVYHYKFYQLISSNNACKETWKMMSKISAIEPHKLQRAGLLLPIDEETKELISDKKVPLFKLTWKIKAKTWSSDSVLGYLFNTN